MWQLPGIFLERAALGPFLPSIFPFLAAESAQMRAAASAAMVGTEATRGRAKTEGAGLPAPPTASGALP